MRHVIGLMSGTSLDGADAILARFWEERERSLRVQAFPPTLPRARAVLATCRAPTLSFGTDAWERFADAAAAVAARPTAVGWT
jgi:1,6-anhydro-N-acetylmuramate kinase